jgi:restriction system protein
VPVPDFQTLMRPLLVQVEGGQARSISDIREALADEFQLTDEDLAERIPSGRVTKLQNRVGWAATYLYRCGLLERPRRAHYRITDRGRETLRDHPDRVDLDVLRQFEEFAEFRRRSRDGETDGDGVGDRRGGREQSDQTAEERIDAAYRELRTALVGELLDRVREERWDFFEDLVLDVLKAAGYGGPEGATERLGASGDGGVDGVIREDALGLDLIYVQAKAWTNTVGRPDIQRFFGALHGKRASKGIFITTSNFSREAIEYAEGVTPRVILVGGERLAELMIDHGIGVSVEHRYEIKRVDLDYFVRDEEAGRGETRS